MTVSGNVPWIHGNKSKKLHNALKFTEAKYAVDFLIYCTEEISLPRPAAPRGRDAIPPAYLPAKTTKIEVRKLYRQVCDVKKS